MSHKQKAINGFKNRMKATFEFSISPLTLLKNIFAFTKGRDSLMMFLFNILATAVFLLAAPFLLLATPVTLGLGLLAALAQTLFFPFQFLVAAIKDVFSSSAPQNDKKPNNNNATTQNTDTTKNQDVDLQASKHYSPLFGEEKQSTVEPKEPLIISTRCKI